MKMRNAIVALSGIVLGIVSQAAPLAYEGFDYTIGWVPINNGSHDGGTGWTDAWSGSNTLPKVRPANGSEDSLSYSTLTGVGGVAQAGSDTFSILTRKWDSAMNSGKYYISGMFNYVEGEENGTIGLRVGRDNGSGGVQWSHLFGLENGKGIINDDWYTANNAGNKVITDTALSAGTHFLVLEFDFDASSDTAKLFIDPVLSSETPLTADLTLENISWVSQVDTLGIFWGNDGTGNKQVDEIRIGTTWTDVTTNTAVPEPSAAVLSVVALSTLLIRRRK